jgi:hypothetical protein
MNVHPRGPGARTERQLPLEPLEEPLGFCGGQLIRHGAPSEATHPEPVPPFARAPPAGGAAHG